MLGQDNVPLEFKGSGSEYFAIWIVNVILSVLTLGIYSAWAKVRTKRYLYGNTSIDGLSFEYHANPITILKGRLIAFALLFVYFTFSEFYPLLSLFFIPVFALIIPWIVWRSIIFNAKMSSIRNVHFGFKGELKGSYLYYLLAPFLIPFLLGLLVYIGFGLPQPYQAEFNISFLTGYIVIVLLFPYAHKLQMVYYINNMYYGQGRFSTKIFASKFYLIDVIAFLIFVGAVILTVTPIYLIVIIGVVAEYNGVGIQEMLYSVFMLAPFLYIPFAYILLLSAVFLGKAYFTAHLRKYVYKNTHLNGVIGLSSELNTWYLFWIYLSNFFLLVFTLGFAYPWTVVRTTRYMVETISVSNAKALSQFISEQQQQQSALGEEMVDAFDVDIGIF